MSQQSQPVGGVQPWSVGEIYPYHIVIVGNGPRAGVVYAEGPRGKLGEHAFESMGVFNRETKRMEGGDFHIAHRKAELEAEIALAHDRAKQLTAAV